MLGAKDWFGVVPEELHAKGYDAYIIARWLAWQLQEEPAPDECSKVFSLLWLANSSMNVLGNAGSWLSETERQHVQIVGAHFRRFMWP